MRTVNPLHILLLLTVFLLFVVFERFEVKKQLEEERNAYKKSEKLAKELLSYKKLFATKERVQSGILKITSQRSLKDAHLKIIKKDSSIEIVSKSIDLADLNSLIRKLLNGAYIIETLDISRIDDKHAALKVEVRW